MPRATVDQLWIILPYITTAATRLLRTQAGGTGARSAFGPSFLLQQQTMGSPFECKKGYSISREFLGSTVLITGASGYIGSLLVEQLLRTTETKRIYVLIRGKKGSPAQDRLQTILHSGLFHLVRDDRALLSKVHLLEGDLNSDNLGLSAADQAKVFTEVQFVVHSAASIELEADVQHTLRSNYLGTRRLLRMATRMNALRCFLHVSTAYVNVNQPRGTYVEERIYPLSLGEQPISHAEIVDDLLSLQPDEANCRAQMYLDMWGFPNTYTMGKHFTEQLVAEFHKTQLPAAVAIVRPTLVCGLAGAPYPGYCGNLAGPIGMGVAVAIGLYDHLDSVAMVPTHVWDAVPSDVVTSVILAAAAATAAGVQINEYPESKFGSNADPMIVHAGTSTTYPISFAEAAWAGQEFITNNPPPFRLPGGSLFRIPLDFRPDEAKVARRKAITAWKVWIAVKLLEALGQHKTARRLKYGHMCWAIQNNAKTDRNLFFGSRNLKALATQLSEADQASGHYTVMWTTKTGGWPRYINTNLAGLYRLVFGIDEVKGVNNSDFKFIPNKKPEKPVVPDAIAASANDQEPLNRPAQADAGLSGRQPSDDQDFVEKGLRSTASMFASIPASGARMQAFGDSQPNREFAAMPMGTHVQANGRASIEVLSSTTSENAGGMRAAITNKLGSTLSVLSSVQSGGVPDYEKKKDTKPLSDTGLRSSLSLRSKNE